MLCPNHRNTHVPLVKISRSACSREMAVSSVSVLAVGVHCLSSAQSRAAIRRMLLLVPRASFVISSAFLAATITMGETSAFSGYDAGKGGLLLAQDATPSQSASATTGIIPADRRTTWNPGLNAVGGIPNRTMTYVTLSPLGGSLDDTMVIQRALDTCPRGQVVKLSPGTFNINGKGLYFRRSECTLRGSGTGALGSGDGGIGSSKPTATPIAISLFSM